MKRLFVFMMLVAVASLGASHAYAMGEAVQAISALPSFTPYAAMSAGMLAMSQPGLLPRAISSRIFANVDPKTMMAQLSSAFTDYKVRSESRVDSLQANFQNAIDEISNKVAAAKMNGGGAGGHFLPEDPEYSKTFASWARGGQNENDVRSANMSGERGQVRAAMSVGSNSDGGYLAPSEWDRRLLKALASISPMRRISHVQSTSVGAFTTVWSNGATGSGWVGETASRPATSTPTLSLVPFTHGEIYANPAITQQLLDDSALDLEEWIANEIASEFDKQEGIAFVSGNGTNKPRGFLTYVTGGASDNVHPGGNLVTVPSGGAASVTADALISFSASLPAKYRQNANWLMSSATSAILATMKDGQGNYLWRPSFIVGQPATLLGFPVEIDENMPSIAAGTLPIAFGDFQKGYLINDRKGIRMLRDPFTNKPYVSFYTTKRVGGGVDDPTAIRLLKIGVS